MKSASMAICTALLLLAGSVGAEARPVVIIDGSAPTQLSEARFSGELLAMGFDVRETGAGEPPGEAGVPSAVVTIRDRHIKVMVTGMRGPARERHEVEIEAGQTDEDLDAAMLHAAEFLRASFLSFGFNLPRPAPEPARPPPAVIEARSPAVIQPRRPPAPAPVEQQEKGPGVSLGIGYGIAAGNGGMSSSGHVMPFVAWTLGRRFDLVLGGVLTTSPASASTGAGTTEVRLTALMPGARWSPIESRWISPYVETGVGLGLIAMSATPASGYWKEDRSAVTVLPFGGAGLSLFHGPLRPRFGILAGTSLQRERLLTAGQQAGTWGRLFLLGSAQIELSIE